MWMEHDLLAELEVTMVPLVGRKPRRDVYMPWHEEADRSRTSTRTFWCAAKNQEVEVEFETKRVLGFPRVRDVKRCSAFDEPEQVACGRQCLDSRYRRQWPNALPVVNQRRPPGT
jgi:hypothetical protein